MPNREQITRRQKVLADFGDLALRSDDLEEVLTEACRLVSGGLGADLAKVLEIDHEQQKLLVKAGVGWKSGIVGQMRLPMRERSSETYSIDQAKPVVSTNINEEERFDFPDFMKDNGVVALVNAPIFLPGGRAYGLLQVDFHQARDFSADDVAFLRTYTAILGPVIDRLHKVHSLQIALDTNQHLLQELQHRIKNHIGTITALVRIRLKDVRSQEARHELIAIGERIETLRLVHEQLYSAGTAERLKLPPYLMQLIENLCRMHEDQSGEIKLDIAIEAIELGPDTAVPLGLILTEFITNSLKYAFDGEGGTITVDVGSLTDGRIRVRLSDNGKGLPAEPRPSVPGSGTGMKLIAGLVRQIDAEPAWSSLEGTALCFEFMPY